MPDLEYEVFCLSKVNELLRFRNLRSYGLFQKHMDSAFQKLRGDSIVLRSRHYNAHRLNAVIEFGEVAKGLGIMLGCKSASALGIRVDNTQEIYLGHTAIFLSMEFSEIAGANNADVQFVHRLRRKWLVK